VLAKGFCEPIEPKLLPQGGQHPDISQSAGRIKDRRAITKRLCRIKPKDARKPLMHGFNRLAHGVQSPKRGNGALLRLPCLISERLHQLHIAAGTRLRDFEEHAITIPLKLRACQHIKTKTCHYKRANQKHLKPNASNTHRQKSPLKLSNSGGPNQHHERPAFPPPDPLGGDRSQKVP
jgi:hypothetical protein